MSPTISEAEPDVAPVEAADIEWAQAASEARQEAEATDAPLTVQGKKTWRKETYHISNTFPNPFQPRTNLAGIEELAENIIEYGLKDEPTARIKDGRIEFIDGGRRRESLLILTAAGHIDGFVTLKIANWDVTDEEMVQLALDADTTHNPFTALDRAKAYADLERLGVTQTKIAERNHISQPAVSNLIRLLALPAEVKTEITEGRLSAGHGGALLALPTGDERIAFALRAKQEQLSVNSLAKAIRSYMDEQKAQSEPALPNVEEEAPAPPTEAPASEPVAPPVATSEPAPVPPDFEEQVQKIFDEAKSQTNNSGEAAPTGTATPAQSEDEDQSGTDVEEAAPTPESETDTEADDDSASEPSGDAPDAQPQQEAEPVAEPTKTETPEPQTPPAKENKSSAAVEKKTPVPASTGTSSPATTTKAPEGFISTFVPQGDCFWLQDEGYSMQEIFSTMRQLVELGQLRGLTPDDLLTTLRSTLGLDENQEEEEGTQE